MRIVHNTLVSVQLHPMKAGPKSSCENPLALSVGCYRTMFERVQAFSVVGVLSLDLPPILTIMHFGIVRYVRLIYPRAEP